MHIILCYDITDKKRLAKIARLASKYMFRLQFSVYYADLTPRQIALLTEQLKDTMNHKHDKVSLFGSVSLAQAVLFESGHTFEGLGLYDDNGNNCVSHGSTQL